MKYLIKYKGTIYYKILPICINVIIYIILVGNTIKLHNKFIYYLLFISCLIELIYGVLVHDKTRIFTEHNLYIQGATVMMICLLCSDSIYDYAQSLFINICL